MKAIEFGEINMSWNAWVTGCFEIVAIAGFEVVVTKTQNKLEFFPAPCELDRIPLGAGSGRSGLAKDLGDPAGKLKLPRRDTHSEIGFFCLSQLGPQQRTLQRMLPWPRQQRGS